MRFLIDAQLPPALARFLEGHTRIMVWQVFEHLALEEPLESFPKHFPGRISLAAVREALQLGKQLFARNGDTWQRAVACLE